MNPYFRIKWNIPVIHRNECCSSGVSQSHLDRADSDVDEETWCRLSQHCNYAVKTEKNPAAAFFCSVGDT